MGDFKSGSVRTVNVNLEALMLVAREKELTRNDLRIFMLLMSMCEYGQASVRHIDLSELLYIDRSNITRSINKLERMGLVVRAGMAYSIDPMILYMGRKDQLTKHIRMHQNKLKRKRREAFYAKEEE